jgi:hypothetical protein
VGFPPPRKGEAQGSSSELSPGGLSTLKRFSQQATYAYEGPHEASLGGVGGIPPRKRRFPSQPAKRAKILQGKSLSVEWRMPSSYEAQRGSSKISRDDSERGNCLLVHHFNSWLLQAFPQKKTTLKRFQLYLTFVEQK